MRRCEDCQIILDRAVRFCPKCGKPVESGSGDEADVRSLLDSANTKRLRQDWDGAIQDAADALRLDPDNPNIPSLLADIYEQRGMADEARVWSQRVLELNPDSPFEKARQNRLRRQTGATAKPRPGSSADLLQLRIKIGAAVLAGICLIVAVICFINPSKQNPKQGSKMSSGARSDTPGAVNLGGTPSNQMTGGMPQTSAPAAAQRPQAGVPASGSSTLRTNGELDVKTTLQNAQISGVTVDDAVYDPRQNGVLIITFSLNGAQISRDSVLYSAWALARTTFVRKPEINYVVTRCISNTGEAGGTYIAFVGDLSRAVDSTLPPNPTTQALSSAFINPFWNQAIAQRPS